MNSNETQNMQFALLNQQLQMLLEGETNPITNMSQFAALVFDGLADVNWAGFYLNMDGEGLKLGPFQGLIACTNIPIGKGVVGHVAQTRKAIVVPDIEEFPGHIVCDSRSRSEVVCPIIVENEVIGVFDIDSPSKKRFTSTDLMGVETLIESLVSRTNWDRVR